MVKDFRHYCFTHNPKPGEIWTWGGVGGIQIVNLMEQEPASLSKGGHPGKASLSNLERAFKAIIKFLKQEKVVSIAIPKLATDVGGLDWKDVKDSITKHIGDLDIPVYIYSTFTKGKKASEA
jgi:O-acetyl-ADP-ribose deacetylase (regulator of RNase III)